jgi:hypothetical protein
MEVSPDGSPDKNVFDIQQGVAIIIAIKRRHHGKSKDKPVAVLQADLWGTREAKYEQLWSETLRGEGWLERDPSAPLYRFCSTDELKEAQYKLGFGLAALFPVNGTGIVTKRDHLNIHHSAEEAWQMPNDFIEKTEAYVRQKYALPADVRDWHYEWAVADAKEDLSRDKVTAVNYRLFDKRFMYYTGRSRGLCGWPVEKLMRHFIGLKNFGIVTVSKQLASMPTGYYFVSDAPVVNGMIRSDSVSIDSLFPLYLYPDEQDLDQSIRVNFDPKLYAQIRKSAGLTGPLGVPDPAMVESGAFRDLTGDARPDEVKVFDYIYGVLHCPAYRETYAEFLKIDFPRVPFPPSPEVFRTISEQGEALRRLHLMEDAAIGATPYPFHGEGDNVVEKPRFENGPEAGRVYINGKGTDGQYFDAVPPIAWDFPIGGYQPAQKWLKDRKGRALSWDDIRHYQKIIKILAETDRIMRGIAMPLGDVGEG